MKDMSKEWANRPPTSVSDKMAESASSAPVGGVDFGDWGKVASRRDFLTKAARVLGVGALVTGGLSACAPGETRPTETQPTKPAATETAKPWPTEVVPTAVVLPTEKPTVAPTEVPTKEIKPTPTGVIEMGISEMGIGGNETDILQGVEIRRIEINEQAFNERNKGAKLLAAEGTGGQAFIQLERDGKVLALGNFNLPRFKEGQVNYQPVFNTPDFEQMMGWVDNEGNWLFHVPLMAGQEGRAPVTFQRGMELKTALLDQNGIIVSGMEKDFWQKMPEKAVKAVMAKYENAVYVTFWDKNGNQLEGSRIKVVTLSTETVNQTRESLIKIAVEHKYNFEYSGITVPFIAALHPSITTRADSPVKDVWLNTKDFPNGEAERICGEIILRIHHQAWIADDKTNRANTSFEQYIGLVKQGKGNYHIMASVDSPQYKTIQDRAKIRPNVEVDPKKPVKVVLSDRRSLPVELSGGVGFWLVQDQDGSLIIEQGFLPYRLGGQPDDLNRGAAVSAGLIYEPFNYLTINDELLSGKKGEIGGLIDLRYLLEGIYHLYFVPPQVAKKAPLFGYK